MSKNKIYNRFQRYVKDKDISVNFFVNNTLSKTLSMFVYQNLPPTIPQYELEKLLQLKGYCFVTEVDGNLYALSGGLCGEVDAYYRPKQITVANVGLNLSKTFTVYDDLDGVLCKNDFLGNGLLPIFGKYAVLLTDSTISLNTVAVLSRLTMILTASDEKTKQSADIFIEKILNGDFTVIAENAFLKGATFQQCNNASGNHITELIELNQYYKANMLNEIGLNAQFNMKRERLTANEVLLNADEILPFVDNMLQSRRDFVNRINAKYGTEITVDLNTAWKTEKENNDKSIEFTDTETASETAQNVSVETVTKQAETETKPNETENETETKQAETETRRAETDTDGEENETETAQIVKLIRDMRENELQNENV